MANYIPEEKQNRAYPTIVNTIADLHARGFCADFSLIGNRLFCSQKECFYNADQFDIMELYCFENEVSPAEETLVYAIACPDSDMKGILLQMYNLTWRGINNALQPKIRKFWK